MINSALSTQHGPYGVLDGEKDTFAVNRFRVGLLHSLLAFPNGDVIERALLRRSGAARRRLARNPSLSLTARLSMTGRLHFIGRDPSEASVLSSLLSEIRPSEGHGGAGGGGGGGGGGGDGEGRE